MTHASIRKNRLPAIYRRLRSQGFAAWEAVRAQREINATMVTGDTLLLKSICRPRGATRCVFFTLVDRYGDHNLFGTGY